MKTTAFFLSGAMESLGEQYKENKQCWTWTRKETVLKASQQKKTESQSNLNKLPDIC